MIPRLAEHHDPPADLGCACRSRPRRRGPLRHLARRPTRDEDDDAPAARHPTIYPTPNQGTQLMPHIHHLTRTVAAALAIAAVAAPAVLAQPQPARNPSSPDARDAATVPAPQRHPGGHWAGIKTSSLAGTTSHDSRRANIYVPPAEVFTDTVAPAADLSKVNVQAPPAGAVTAVAGTRSRGLDWVRSPSAPPREWVPW